MFSGTDFARQRNFSPVVNRIIAKRVVMGYTATAFY
jgi:hypothetical protein